MANAHLAYPDLALEKFSGTDPDQDAESFVPIIERKINFALGDAPADADEFANYTFSKNSLFSSLLRGPAAEWYENSITNVTTWENVRKIFIFRFSDGRNKFGTEWKWNNLSEEMKKKLGTFYTASKERLTKAGPMIWMLTR